VKKYIILSCVFLFFLFYGCVSTINDTKLNISVDNIQQTEILPLKNGNNDITFYSIGSNVMEKSGFFCQNENKYGYYVIAMDSRNKEGRNQLIFGWINGLTLFIPSLLGFPTESSEITMTAYLYIFDSNGKLIKYYQNTNSFSQTTGLYYGKNPHGKASVYYSRLFTEILDQVNTQKDEINNSLENAGPITNDNMRIAQENIREYFRVNRTYRY